MELKLPEYLYHGFDFRQKRHIDQRGLKPRCVTKIQSMWPDLPSADNLVYLTNGWAMYYSAHACRDLPWDERVLGIAEIKVSSLDPLLLRPDEDCVFELYQRLVQNQLLHKDMQWLESLRSRFGGVPDKLSLRPRLAEFPDLVPHSLHSLGTAGYQGSIPPEAIKTKLFPMADFKGESEHLGLVVRHLKYPDWLHFTKQGAGMIAITNYLFNHAQLPTREALKKQPLCMPYMGF